LEVGRKKNRKIKRLEARSLKYEELVDLPISVSGLQTK